MLTVDQVLTAHGYGRNGQRVIVSGSRVELLEFLAACGKTVERFEGRSLPKVGTYAPASSADFMRAYFDGGMIQRFRDRFSLTMWREDADYQLALRVPGYFAIRSYPTVPAVPLLWRATWFDDCGNLSHDDFETEAAAISFLRSCASPCGVRYLDSANGFMIIPK